MKKIISALPCLVWGAVALALAQRDTAMPVGLYYGGLIIAMMLGIMLGVLANGRK